MTQPGAATACRVMIQRSGDSGDGGDVRTGMLSIYGVSSSQIQRHVPGG
ncbi:hypothetical protein E2C01_080757 [Portunus trituberculatus]|uniref:Uncharacterized protein n=1 Tax=Portunus trituberculatus TaxID=210409 RepID=A0A5B7IMZ7_PORTR|nr:hypothetical protein [Portunus trituberculatus]